MTSCAQGSTISSMRNKTRLQLFVSNEDAKLLKQSAIEGGTTLSNHIVETASIFTFQLTNHVTCKISYIGEVKSHTEFWRVDIELVETKTGYCLRYGWYEIWASQEYIEDFLKLSKSPDKKDIAQFAYLFISRRYKESNDELPKEYGAFCSNKTGIKLVDASGTLLSYFQEINKENAKG